MEADSQNEDLPNESNSNNFSSDKSANPEVVIEQLKNIAESGTVDINWHDLQQALKLRLRTVIDHYIEKDKDSKEDQYQEPNVEKFNLDNSRDEILDLIESFTEAPFTIQRICELLYSPFKYYDRISTFLRGLEKNLRVISSYNWPKSRSEEPEKGDLNQNKLENQEEQIPLEQTS